MSWFSNQIDMREQADQEALEDAFQAIIDAITKNQTSSLFTDAHQEAADALNAVLGYYRFDTSDTETAAFLESGGGKDAASLSERFEIALRDNDLIQRQVELKPDFYKYAIAPIIAIEKETGHLVVLLPSGMGGYKYTDSQGNKRRANKNTFDLFEPEAFTFYKLFPRREMKTRDFFRYVLSVLNLSDVILFAAMSLFVVLLGMFTPKITNLLFSQVVPTQSFRLLIGLAIFALCVSISTALMQATKAIMTLKISAKISYAVQAATMMRLLSLPVSFFKNYSSGDISSRAAQTTSLASSFVSLVLSSGLTSLFSLVYVGQVFNYAPSLVGVVLLVIALQIVISFATVRSQNIYNARRLDLAAKQSGLAFSILSGVQKIRLSGAENRFFARWGKGYAKTAAVVYNPPFLVRHGATLSAAVVAAGTIAMYYLAVQSGISVADYYAFTAAYSLASGAFLTLSSTATQAAGLKAVIQTVSPIFEAKPEYDPSKKIPKQFKGNIEFSHVSFRYDASHPLVLNDVSFKIHKGEYVAIVGKTGCGKSTLIRLLLGFETPQNGAVYFDDSDVSTLDMQLARKQLGLVLQDGKLMQGDIFSNMAISTPDLTVDGAWEALEKADLADDVRAMPMGLHTMISENSGGLSGGQKQRLLIARAVSGNPQILVFDEATSALDNLTQKKISQTLDSLDCTRIVIAHRLSTIKLCDRILVFDQGKIAEEGTFDELLEKKGIFADLVARQM